MKAKNAYRRHKRFWDGADLVMEVVSDDPKDRKRDWQTKVREYARAGIGEYWIIDPEERKVRILTLDGQAYKIHGDFGPGSEATSLLLPGFTVAVDTVLTPPGSQQAQ
jgi:Uma2 family endonuclease